MGSRLPLTGVRVVEFAGLAPAPFAGLVLSDFGASVIRIDKPDDLALSDAPDVLCRGKRSLAVSPKTATGLAVVKRLLALADVVIDPFRPGVLEKLGLGPDIFLAEGGSNKRLVYARLSGFPAEGKQGNMAGHDINCLAMSGILSMLPGTSERPSFPLNLLADFAGGGLMCVVGILLALYERQKTGLGQIVNSDMVSGTRYLSSFPLLHASLASSPYFDKPRTENVLDGGAPFYDVYTCSDGRWVSVGCLEPQFYRAFLHHFRRGLPEGWTCDTLPGFTPTPDAQTKRAEWPMLRQYLEAGFQTNTRDYWARIFHSTDSCVLPVLTASEAATASGSPAPARHPELASWSASPPSQPIVEEDRHGRVLQRGSHTDEILAELGLTSHERRELATDGALGQERRERAVAARL